MNKCRLGVKLTVVKMKAQASPCKQPCPINTPKKNQRVQLQEQFKAVSQKMVFPSDLKFGLKLSQVMNLCANCVFRR